MVLFPVFRRLRRVNSESRIQAVRDHLSPLLASITVSPALIDTLMETEPSEAWLQPVADLERVLLSLRSGPRIAVRKDLDEVVERLRIRVRTLIRRFQYLHSTYEIT